MHALFISKKRAKEKNPQKNEDFLFLTPFSGFFFKKDPKQVLNTPVVGNRRAKMHALFMCKNARQRIQSSKIPRLSVGNPFFPVFHQRASVNRGMLISREIQRFCSSCTTSVHQRTPEHIFNTPVLSGNPVLGIKQKIMLYVANTTGLVIEELINRAEPS